MLELRRVIFFRGDWRYVTGQCLACVLIARDLQLWMENYLGLGVFLRLLLTLLLGGRLGFEKFLSTYIVSL